MYIYLLYFEVIKNKSLHLFRIVQLFFAHKQHLIEFLLYVACWFLFMVLGSN